MRILSIALLSLALASANGVSSAQEAPAARISAYTGAVSEAQLRADLTTLVGFGTRHTLSDTVSETRGIGAARRWIARRFDEISATCGKCLDIQLPAETITLAPRIPNPTEVVNVIAIQKGTGDPNNVVFIMGHYDSRVSDVLNATADAPGANDDGSGTVAVIEAARVLSQHKFPATIVYAALAGEEQGLVGAGILARYVTARGWKVLGALNNDIIGNSISQNGTRNSFEVRVLSEGVKATENPQQAALRQRNGGEVDSPSRNLARFVDRVAEDYLSDLDVKMIYRTDRFGRGGDHVRFLEAGFPAVRLIEPGENYDHQHQDVRTENGKFFGDTLDYVDFAYLAKVTRLNVAALAALALAPPAPDNVAISGQVSADTTLRWSAVPGAAGYRVWWRDTIAPQWQWSRKAGKDATSLTLKDVVIDDYAFGVSAISADGFESPIVFPGPAGDWYEAPAAPAQPR